MRGHPATASAIKPAVVAWQRQRSLPASRRFGGGIAALLTIVLLHVAGLSRFLAELAGAGDALPLLLWLLCYVAAAAALLARRDLASILRAQPLLVALLAFAALSIVWSPLRDLSILGRIVHLLGSTILAVALGACVPIGTLLRAIGAALAILVIGGLAAALVLPDHGRQLYDGVFVWKGLQGDKNAFGSTATLAMILFTVRGLTVSGSAPGLSWLAAALSLAALFFSHSATSLAALVISVLVLIILLAPIILRLSPQISLLTLVLLGLAFAALLAASGLDTVLAIAGRSSDFTGRSEIWQGAWALVHKQPWLGYGYGTIWFPADSFGEETQRAFLGTTWSAAHAHNGFLQVASELGIPAAVAACAYAILGTARAMRCYLERTTPLLLLIVGLQIAFLVGNLFEARLMVSRNLEWILFVALTVALTRLSDARSNEQPRYGRAGA